MTTATRPLNREAEISERFAREAGEHRMRVLHDDGLYRHLRFTRGGSWCYGYDLITWPGHLAIAGDCGDYTFARTADMFSFFRSAFKYGEPRINPDYWSEKLTNRHERDGTRQYAEEGVRPRVMEWYRDHVESYGETPGLLDALNEQVLWRELYSRERAVHLLCEFEYQGVSIYEPYDWNLDEWDWPFLWCCWGIVQGIAQYDWAKGWTS